jgi:hypothetical protein
MAVCHGPTCWGIRGHDNQFELTRCSRHSLRRSTKSQTTAQVRCEVPLLHRHHFSQIGPTGMADRHEREFLQHAHQSCPLPRRPRRSLAAFGRNPKDLFSRQDAKNARKKSLNGSLPLHCERATSCLLDKKDRKKRMEPQRTKEAERRRQKPCSTPAPGGGPLTAAA